MKKLKGLGKHLPVDFLGFMDGYCSMFEDMPDGAWQAACESAVKAFNRTYGTKVDPYDGWMFWCEDSAAMSPK